MRGGKIKTKNLGNKDQNRRRQKERENEKYIFRESGDEIRKF